MDRLERAIMFRDCIADPKATQTENTLAYLKEFGEITPIEALNAFGCFRLSGRIYELRDEGYDIETEIATGEKRYAIYKLIPGEETA